jgi:predicted amidohydrolase YtcJ
MKMSATGDLVLVNGNVITMDPARPRASAVGIRDGRIVVVGSDAEARAALPGAETIDLGGRTATPGFIDAHIHLLAYGHSLSEANLYGAATIAAAVGRSAAVAARLPAGAWLTGGGWRRNDLADRRLPTAADLDAAIPDRPAMLYSHDHHSIWCNSAALAAAGVTAATPDPDGGKLERDGEGRPTGILYETAETLILRHIPEPTEAQHDAALRAGLAALAARGHTGVQNFTGGASLIDRRLALGALQRARAAGELTLRVYQLISSEDLDAAIQIGLRTGLGDDWLRIGHLKFFADGALGSRTAWMVEPYEGQPDNIGVPIHPVERLRELVEQGARAGLAPAIHAIGDRANHEVLNIFEAGRREGWLPPAMRPRIEHVQVLLREDVPRLARLDIIGSMQPIHCTSDMLAADENWGGRSRYAYAWNSLLERGTILAFGSDAPVEEPDVIAGLHAAVTRQRANGQPAGGWYPDERVMAEEALRAYTVGAAYAAGEEAVKGSLTPDKLGDLTILSADPTALPGPEILGIQVEQTIVGGRVVYRRER